MTDREKRAFEDAEQQIKDCNLSFAYIQGMQHCLDIFRHHLEYEDTAEGQKEMILASAIKFHIDKTDEDVVLCGLRHGDIFRQLKSLGFEPREGYEEISQGFITDKGKYLDRVDALSYALKYGQITDAKGKTELFSEDLW